MYSTYNITDTIRVPPKDFGPNLKENIFKIAKQEYEGIMDEDMGVVVAVTSVDDVGEGKVIPGDGAAYYATTINMIVYKPQIHELVEGAVSEVTEFGAFLKIGPIEGLIHVSQIMDDYINYDAKLPGFMGKETKAKLIVNDQVLARVVTVSLKGTISSSKIGLTMRQEGLGKEEWKSKKKKEDIKGGKK